MKTQGKTMFHFIREYPVIPTAILFTIYIVLFSVLENADPASVYLIDTGLDHLIPFSKYAVFLYCTWHLEIAAILLSFLHLRDFDGYWHTAGQLLLGLFLILFICALFPNMVDLRPSEVPGDDVFAEMTRLIYSMDDNCNVFPSGHALGAVLMAFGWSRIADRPWQKAASWTLNAGIILSTLLLKQHSVIDAAGGIILALVIEVAAESVLSAWRQRRPKVWASTVLPKI